jgi:hypothetical protein
MCTTARLTRTSRSKVLSRVCLRVYLSFAGITLQYVCACTKIKSCPSQLGQSVGFLRGGGGGGGGLRAAAAFTGEIGVCKVSASVYSSSSDDEDEDRGDSSGESKGFVAPGFKFRNSAIEMAPLGYSAG